MFRVDWLLEPGCSPKEPLSGGSGEDSQCQRRRGVVILLAGLTGGSHETYCQWAAVTLFRHGFTVAVLNARGCGDEPLRGGTVFSACFTADLDQLAREVRRRAGSSSPVFVVGFSFGGTILSNWLCQQGRAAREIVDGAVVLGADYDLGRNNRRLQETSSALTPDGDSVPPYLPVTEEEAELGRPCCLCCPSPWLPALYHWIMTDALRSYVRINEAAL